MKQTPTPVVRIEGLPELADGVYESLSTTVRAIVAQTAGRTYNGFDLTVLIPPFNVFEEGVNDHIVITVEDFEAGDVGALADELLRSFKEVYSEKRVKVRVRIADPLDVFVDSGERPSTDT